MHRPNEDYKTLPAVELKALLQIYETAKSLSSPAAVANALSTLATSMPIFSALVELQSRRNICCRGLGSANSQMSDKAEVVWKENSTLRYTNPLLQGCIHKGNFH